MGRYSTAAAGLLPRVPNAPLESRHSISSLLFWSLLEHRTEHILVKTGQHVVQLVSPLTPGADTTHAI